MKTLDILFETYLALMSNKTRTMLTILGIVIGIGSVIAMISIGQGAQRSIQDRIESIGSNLVQIVPGSQGGVGSQVSQGRGTARTLIMEDSFAILEKVNYIEGISPELSSRYQVVGKGKNTNTSILGVNDSYINVKNISINEGSFISSQHLKSLSKVAVLGPNAKNDLFGEDYQNVIGENIRINGIQFKIIGITEAKGGTGFGSQDDLIFIPLSSAQKFLSGGDYLTNISVKVTDSKYMEIVEEEITNLLLDRHNISDPLYPDFNVINQNDIVETASSITETFTLLLGAVASISLLVGGIGIMNMMLTTVTERTKEIGLRKAIGARRRDINKQFLIEAIVLTLIGGVFGILFGLLISFLVDYFNFIETSVSIGSILLAFGVSSFIGIVFGYYPAKKASELNPIDALRYE